MNRGIPIPLRSATIVLQRVTLLCRRYLFPWLVLLEVYSIVWLVGAVVEKRRSSRGQGPDLGERVLAENGECLNGDEESDKKNVGGKTKMEREDVKFASW